ncbi:E3 ubiquitin-protein ligase RBBP6-like [Mycteria americana]|uniref:E3 ubiquitin-protein ligase RBBP6-like n=1 Tax=Mycteria americana TaxID=33587 RepID=UPI003F581864
MSCVHYKFSSKLNYDTVTFNGLNISLCDLKRQIMSREKLKVANCDLQITNAQTKEEYTDDNALIPRNSSVIVRRIPVGGVKATNKTFLITFLSSSRSRSEPVIATSKAVRKNQSQPFFYTLFLILNNIDDSSAPISLAQLIQLRIRTALLDSEEHTCPTCHQTDISPDALIANKALRKKWNRLHNKGCASSSSSNSSSSRHCYNLQHHS